MNATLNSFLVPREQWLAWKYLSITPRPSPQEGGNAQNGPHFFFWARNAIYHALEALEVPRHSRALLPAYLCRAAAEPFAAYGLECDFYDLKRDCTPDFSVIDAKIRPETRVVLTAHYFGFPQKIEEFSDLCRRRNLLLFEDCAHVLRTEFRGRGWERSAMPAFSAIANSCRCSMAQSFCFRRQKKGHGSWRALDSEDRPRDSSAAWQ